jgi:hypothetical protein
MLLRPGLVATAPYAAHEETTIIVTAISTHVAEKSFIIFPAPPSQIWAFVLTQSANYLGSQRTVA